MASGIDIKNRQFFPLFRKKKDEKDTHHNQHIDQRWSASSGKMSSLTARILAVNIIALMILGGGVLYLGQYTDSLIESELESMRAEARFFSGALSEGAVRPVFQISAVPFEEPMEIEAIKPSLARSMIRRLGENSASQVQLFSVDGTILADTHKLTGSGGTVQIETLKDNHSPSTIGELFEQSAIRFLDLIPTQTYSLADLEKEGDFDFFSFSDTKSALLGTISATAWKQKDGNIVLTAAAPIQRIKQVLGVALLIRDGAELQNKISDIRVNVFRVFLGSLAITVMLSIYLSGLIGRPLKKLALAAEAVRTGKGRQIEIPDMSERGDEIGELSLVLRDMTHALWDRMDSIERFAADVSHEIKNPLTSLRSAIETLGRIEDPKNKQKLMNIINHDIQRLDRLISDISNASRLDAELSREEMYDVDLKSLLYRLQDAHKKPMERAKGSITDDHKNIIIDIPEDTIIHVSGNEDRLGQVFGNLISNALSFSAADSVIRIYTQINDDVTTIIVEDNGPGIPENKISEIFERFYTERPDHEEYGTHSGLGLSISKQIIDAHGGKIWAENRMNDDGKCIGAKFIVELKAVT